MKFAHLLDTLARANPEFQVLHTLYKQAKKALKRIQLAGIGAFVGPGAVAGTSAAPQQPVPSQQSSQQLGAAAVAGKELGSDTACDVSQRAHLRRAAVAS